MKKQIIFLATGLCLTLLTAAATAAFNDMAPSWRGQDGTTLQQWDFISPVAENQPITPDAGWVNPNGDPLLTYYPGSTTGWMDGDKEHLGVLPLSGSIKIGIPNFPDPNPYKEIFVQLIWAPETPRGNPLVEVVPWQDPFGDAVTANLMQTIALDGDWQYSQYSVRIEPNPDFEYIWISGSIIVDSVIVDTICVPEPATLALIGIGAFLIQRKKRGTTL